MNVLVIGGAGFIGCNLAEHYARQGAGVVVFDNLSRLGTPNNLEYLTGKYPSLRFVRGDIRKPKDLQDLFEQESFDRVFHLAAQVAVTTSVQDPREDFEINALGTFNVLEAMRLTNSTAVLIYSSTNKVYGGMEEIVIVEEKDGRYAYRDFADGIPESQSLDFHSPYGCSKGAGDQYVRDYSRIYGLRTVVLRQSCIYGYRQFGIEDQGWIAWFTIAATLGAPVTIYGDGKQVRDVLFIDDLIAAYDAASEKIDVTNGKVYNIGGGPFRLSLLELVDLLDGITGRRMQVSFADWRPGDQRVYVSNIAKAERDLGWRPVVDVETGVRKLGEWVSKNEAMIRSLGLF